MSTYYNDKSMECCAWLRELIKADLIADGYVDDRPIEQVRPDDLRGIERVHLFAGIGGWDHGLQLAGWPTGRPVWTGSCPCQPFSTAGKRKGTADKRHLWPEMLRLIGECRPATVFGEQVASRAGREWLAGVRADLEALGYAVGAADLCAASEGAPHIRQRLYWVADAGRERDERWRATRDVAGACEDAQSKARQRKRGGNADSDCGATGGMEQAEGQRDSPQRSIHAEGLCIANGSAGRLGDASGAGLQIGSGPQDGRTAVWDEGATVAAAGAWGEFDLVHCRDGKARRAPSAKPIFHLLDDGIPDRMDAGWMEFVGIIERQVMRYAKKTGQRSDQALHALREAIQKSEIQRNTGGRGQVHAQKILLQALRELSGDMENVKDSEVPRISKISSGKVRALRLPAAIVENPSRPPQERKCEGQQARKLRDTVCKLSQAASSFASVISASDGFPLAESFPGRVGLLLGYGNAIVPQVAATFIRAYMECAS